MLHDVTMGVLGRSLLHDTASDAATPSWAVNVPAAVQLIAISAVFLRLHPLYLATRAAVLHWARLGVTGKMPTPRILLSFELL
jgi:hypothetical protein